MRAAAVSVENSFVKGLITEASGLNFPENAVTDTDNCVFDLTGSVTRRLGIEFESNFQAAAVTYDDVAVTEYLWRAVTQDGEKTFLVLQIGSSVSMYEMDTDQSLSSHEAYNFSLDDHAIPGALPTKSISATFASGNGLLFIAHASCQPMYVERTSGGVFSTVEYQVKVRDVFGLDNIDSFGETIPIETRPTAVQLSPAVEYNLKNQGWDTEQWASTAPAVGAALQQMLDFFFIATGHYPAESETWFEYKVPQTTIDNVGNPNHAQNTTVVSGVEILAQKPRNTPAPKGHYIFDAFNIDRNVAADVSGLAIETSGSLRPSCIAFYAGRVFLAGVNATGYNTKIFYSQILQNKKHLGECFQAQDPTQEDGGDIVASDGGWITIPDIARVIHMVQVGTALFIIATNGTWKIAGSEGVGFTATDYSISKISETGAVSNRSFVMVEGTPMWWNLDGIWAIQASNGMDKVVSLSQMTIASYLDTIPAQNIAYVKGSFNPLSRVVQWVFRSTTTETFTQNFEYDRALNLDVNLSAFYPWSFPSDNALKIVGLFCIAGPSTAVQDEPVTDSTGNFVTEADLTEIDIENRFTVETASRFKYITVNTNDLVSQTSAPGTTFDSEFVGDLDDSFASGKNNGNNFQTALYGLDGLIYITQSDGAGTNRDKFLTFDPNTNDVAVVEFDEAQAQTDIAAALADVPGTWNSGFRILPFPYSPYYYVFMTAQPGGSDTNAFLALYRIDSGSHSFLGAWAWTANFRFFQINFHATAYYGQGQQPLSNNLMVAATHGSTLEGNWCDIIYFPSVNDFLGRLDNLGQPFFTEDDWTGIIDAFQTQESEESGMFDPANELTGITSGTILGPTVFFLPIQYDDGSWGTTINSMVPKAMIDYYKANPTSTGSTWNTKLNTIIQGLTSDDLNGVIVSRDMGTPPKVLLLNGPYVQDFPDNARDWHVNRNIGTPFGDENKERDGSVSTNNNGRWMAPSLVNVDANYLLTYVRRYDATIDNLNPTGTYHRVAVFQYAPNTETVKVIGTTTAGNTYDVVSDLGLSSGSRYIFCPTNAYVFWNPDASIIFIYNHNFDFGTDDRSVVSQFGTFVPPSSSSVDLSFSEVNNDSYLDWESTGGTDYTSFFSTGYKLRGQGMKRFQNNYIDLFVRGTENNTFDFQSRWDYATANTTGRWSGIQRVSLTSGTYAYKRRRLLLRGIGIVSQFNVTSVSGLPFDLIGWAVFETGNQGI